jgi:protein-S-isoprenylcysteine O-methyltransferase Ste14
MLRHGFKVRGGTWVLAQLAVFVLFALAPQIGPRWAAAQAFRVTGTVVALTGLAILGYSAANLGRSLTPFPRPLPTAQLVTAGAYRFVRHPIYLGVLLAALGFALLTHSPLRLLLTLALAFFFDRKATIEEIWLLERYPEYQLYRSRVKKLVPWIY